MIAIETGWLPEVPLMSDPGPIDPNRLSLIREDLEALASQAIDKALAPILRRILDVLDVAKYVWRTPNATRGGANWMCKQARNICYLLLALPAQLPFPETSVHSAKAEALRIALLLIILQCTNRMSFRSAQPNLRRLQRALSSSGIDTDWSRSAHIESPSQILNGDTYNKNFLLLWVLLTGRFCAEGEPEELWFLMRAAYVAERHLGIQDCDGLQDLMSQYLYSNTQQERNLMAVAMHLSS